MLRSLVLLFACVAATQALLCQIYGGNCKNSCYKKIDIAGLCDAGQSCCTKDSVCGDKYGGTCVGAWSPCLGGGRFQGQGYDICPGKQQVCCIPNTKIPSTPQPTLQPTSRPTGTAGPTKPTKNTGKCGNSKVAANRIVGGTRAQRGAWPWQISLQSFGSHSCGGSILNENWILTAAHCFLSSPWAWSYTVVAGEHNRNKKQGSEQSINVAQIIRHPQYKGDDPSDPNDIALLRLEKPLNLGTSYTNTICLPEATDTFNNNKDCWITGWGQTTGTAPPATTLMQVKVPVLTNSDCNWKWLFKIQDGMVCAGGGPVGGCRGDSGGPLVCKKNGGYVQVGVVSWGSGACQEQPTVFTRVTKYLSWIRKHVPGV